MSLPNNSAQPCLHLQWDAERERMVQEQLVARDIHDPRVLQALRRVPRHCFVPDAAQELAYTDRPLPLVAGQTVSQPYIVASMTQAAQLHPAARCLEIGTGSGYQTAVLAELAQETYSIEYLPEIAALGRSNLEAAGYLGRVQLRQGDGYRGWPEAAPFDAIVVTAAATHVPQPLLDQLAPGGRVVIPVGSLEGPQVLQVFTRSGEKTAPHFAQRSLFPVRFVPFVGAQQAP